MYYEEKYENGSWWSRGTPNGEWAKFSYTQLEQKIQDLLSQVANLTSAQRSES